MGMCISLRCWQSEESGMTDPLVSTQWLASELGAPDLRVLHCMVALRTAEDGGYRIHAGRSEWEQGRIPGSQPIDVARDLSDQSSELDLMMPTSDQLAAVMSAVGVGDECRVVLYDNQMNMWAARVWWMLRTVGVNALILDGGLAAWTADQRPVECGPGEAAPSAVFTPRASLDVFEDKEGVLAAIGNPDVCIVDALETEVFLGLRQDYARKGHIPGAVNVPFATLVDPATHRYLPLDELAGAVGKAAEAAKVIAYCGAGAAASSVSLTLKRLGRRDVAVYDGSMIEWSQDPNLPMTTDT
jgi:thiosulfate/3-mercaptopyruvate sulfurtransferase